MRFVRTLLIRVVSIGAAMTLATAASAADPPIVAAAGRGVPLLNVEDGRSVPFDNAALEQRLRAARAEPTALTVGDFDGDGLDDVIVGYRTGAGGRLVLFPANPVSIFPNSPVAPDAARRRRLVRCAAPLGTGDREHSRSG